MRAGRSAVQAVLLHQGTARPRNTTFACTQHTCTPVLACTPAPTTPYPYQCFAWRRAGHQTLVYAPLHPQHLPHAFPPPPSLLLPPTVLRMEERGINPTAVALAAGLLAYLFSQPGVLPGLVDLYITAPLQRLSQRVYSKVGGLG